jgi:Ca2+-binding RTX toxin-like protein
MIIGLPVALSMACASLLYILVTGIVPDVIVAQRMIAGVESFPLLAVPFFILAGNLMNIAGVTGRIYAFAVALVGWMKGGLGQVNVIGSVTLSRGAHLNVSQLAGFQPTPGARFTIIANDGTDPVNGTFSGLAEGASFTVNGHRYTITYKGQGPGPGETGNDVVLTASADRTVSGTNRGDTFTDTAGFDTTYKASNGNDAVSGLDGNDILHGGNGDDSLDGGSGKDWLNGGNGDDALIGGSGADRIHGGKGSDHLYGGTGTDYLYGGRGTDYIDAGPGKDYIWGGRGADSFYFEWGDTGTSKGKADIIHDFRHTDTIYLKGPAYTLDDSDKTPGDGEYTIYKQGSDWVVKYNQHDSPDTYHYIIVKGHDPHGDLAWF